MRTLRVAPWLALTGTLLIANTLAAAALPPVVTLSSTDLQADVTVLERAYRELHPGLLRYLSPSELDRAFQDLRREFATGRTVPEAYLAFARFAAKIRCGHTYANFFNQPKDIQQSLFESTPRLPFYFRWFDRKMIVTRDFTEQGALPAGTEVIRVNGIRSQTILSDLLPLARADGANDDKRVDQLSVTGDSIYEPFDIYFPLVFPFDYGALSLEVRELGARRSHMLSVRTLTHAQRVAPIAAREAGRHGGMEALFEWRDMDDGTAYLRMPTWALFDSKWNWSGWLNAHLDALAARNAPALVIDLRGNEGGEDVGDEILQRLIVEDLPLTEGARLVRYRKVPADLAAYLHTWDPSFKDWGNAARDLSQPWPTAPPVNYFALAGGEAGVPTRSMIHPVLPHFAGRVYVLVDASNSSATFQFAEIIREQRLGTIVGQPTGGNRRGINGGAFFFLELPHSRIELDLPLIGYFPKTEEPNMGLIPDVKVEPSAADLASSTDSALAAVKRLLVESDIARKTPRANLMPLQSAQPHEIRQ